MAPDWNPTPKCGSGLHGLLWGTGDVDLLNHLEDKIWMVVEIEEYIDLGEKIKFPECIIRYVGDRDGAVEMIQREASPEYMVHFGVKTVGDNQIAGAGYLGTATAGFEGTIAIWHYRDGRDRLLTGYIGEKLKPNTPYRVEDGKFVEVT